MSLPRSYQFIALRNLSAAGRQCRQLHMTGPATFPSAMLTKAERPASNLPRDVAGLRAECKKRKLDFSGNKNDLMSRLNADEITHSRAFTTAVNASKRPTAEIEQATKPVRHFNTSRALKSPKDSSTIDFAFLPEFAGDAPVESQYLIPVINFSGPNAKFVEHPDPEVMKPEISTMSADSTFSPMTDVHDNNAMPIDFHAVAESVSVAAKKVSEPVVEQMQTGTMRQLWNGLVEDVMGPRGKKSLA